MNLAVGSKNNRVDRIDGLFSVVFHDHLDPPNAAFTFKNQIFCCWLYNPVQMNKLISLLFQRKKKPKDKSVSAALLNEGIVGVIKLASPLTQENHRKKEKLGKKMEEEEGKTEERKDEKMEEGKEERSSTVRKRNKRHLKVTIAPGTVTKESAGQVRSLSATANRKIPFGIAKQ